MYKYEIHLPTAGELAELGIASIKGPLQISAQVNYEHFPPLFVRFLAKATGANGPAGHDLGLLNEGVIDTYLVNLKNLTSTSTTVAVQP